jgi:hypothetical protein
LATRVDQTKLSEQIDEIIGQVKKAILEVDKDAPPSGSQLTIKEADLTLNAINTGKGGVDAGFKIFGHDLGFTADRTKAETHTIELKLKPSAEDAMAFGTEDVQAELVNAMRAIRDSVANASASEPRFALDEASVELNFQVDDDGTIKFILVGEGKRSNVQTVKLTLGSG